MEVNDFGMPKWGSWESLYFDSLKLSNIKNNVAFMNLMLCASKGNSYNQHSLKNCFSTHSNKILEALSPKAIIFSVSVILYY